MHRTMLPSVSLAVLTVLAAAVARSGDGAERPRVASVGHGEVFLARGQQTFIDPLAVPDGNGAPVITDGIFTPGEWDDALRIAASETVTLHFKHFRDVVYVGVRGESPAGIGPSELSVAVPGGPIRKLHVSAQLYENPVPASGPEPRPRFGLTTGWYANELRRDVTESARLEKDGRNPIEIMRATSYPSDGIEFAIRRSKFPGQRWLVRLWASAIIEGKPGMMTFPPAAPEKTTDGWLELRFSN